jgi:hypothetical protein
MTWLDRMPATVSPTRSPTPSPTLSPINGIPHARADAHRCRWDTDAHVWLCVQQRYNTVCSEHDTAGAMRCMRGCLWGYDGYSRVL